jgi:hypothetical protein
LSQHDVHLDYGLFVLRRGDLELLVQAD